MRKTILLAASAIALASCDVPPTPTTNGTLGPVMNCPTYGRDFARMSNKDQDWYLKQGCPLVCPSTANKSGRRFARNVEFDRIVRVKELGCPISDRLQYRLDRGH